jgi:hypothetical protein
MDDSIRDLRIKQLKYIPEETTNLHISLHTVSLAPALAIKKGLLTLQDPKYDINIEEPLLEEEISDWIDEAVSHDVLQ